MDDGADHGLGRDRIRRQIDASLERLGVERVDALPRPRLRPRHAAGGDARGASPELVAAGKVGAVGASQLRRASSWRRRSSSRRRGLRATSGCRTRFSLLDRERERETVFPLCREHGLGYTPFSPLAGGWLTGKYRRGEPLPAGSRMTHAARAVRRISTDRVFDALEPLEREAGRRAASRWRRSRSPGCSPSPS